MKKISLLMIIILVLTMVTTNSYANTTGKVQINPTKAEYTSEEEITVDVKIANLVSDKGIISFGAVMAYENLDFVSIKGANGWSNPFFNEANGKLIADRSGLGTADEVIFQATFKAKSKDVTSAKVEVKNIEVSGGDGVYYLENTSKTIAIKGSSTQDTPQDNTNTDKPNTNTNTTLDTNKPTNTNPTNTPSTTPTPTTPTNTSPSSNNNDNNSNDTTTPTNTNSSSNNNNNNSNNNTSTTPQKIQKDNIANKILPKAGKPTSIIGILLIVAVIVSGIYYIRFKKISKIVSSKNGKNKK